MSVRSVEVSLRNLRAAVAANPTDPVRYDRLAAAFLAAGDLAAAARAIAHGLALAPDRLAAWELRLEIAIAQTQWQAAIAAADPILRVDPHHREALRAGVIAHRHLQQWDEAIALARRGDQVDPTLRDDPDFRESWALACYNRAAIADRQIQAEITIPLYREAIALRPDFRQAQYNLSNALLRLGDFREGFARQELRWHDPHKRSLYTDILERPAWDGSPCFGQTLLLFAEQGYGDTIQFARFVAPAAGRCDRILLRCPPPLVRLLQTLEGMPAWSPRPNERDRFDLQASLMSLPHLLGITLDTLPHRVPYLHAPTDNLPEAIALPPAPSHVRRIAICWASNPTNGSTPLRSCPLSWFLDTLTPLQAVLQAQQPAIALELYSVQKDPSAGDRAALATAGVIDLGPHLRDFADTAALLERMDQVITVDTSVAHLAGALGRPTWILLPVASDWRWLYDRSDSPWYPTVRLFRQRAIGDWSHPWQAIRAALPTTLAAVS
jgi:tetratricopeptide (TPR) repeat protein